MSFNGGPPPTYVMKLVDMTTYVTTAHALQCRFLAIVSLMAHVEIPRDEQGSKDAPVVIQWYVLAKGETITRSFCAK